MKILIPTCYLMVLVFLSCSNQKQHTENPIVDGYYADPAIIKYENKFYIYATRDPWGGEDLAVFVTEDFVTFDRDSLNWPTKTACTSSTSWGAMVWAPDVIKGKDGKFYMYVSVGSEIWAGVSDHPLGPWENAKEDNTPLVRSEAFPGVHSIDAHCFIDDDGQIYLYWGSGLNWVNGRCMAVKLQDDMITFASTPKDITPPNYFEGPYMIKRSGKYYLMYSEGKAIDHTYKVRYSVGNTPLGPWTEGKYSPVLQTSADSTIYGPGHHSVFNEGGQDYILYHRIHPQDEEYVLRELCLDSLNFDYEGNILQINPQGVVQFIE